jgi:flavin reductase (DIM6/NTAB) family NADH-FMN oxidoreductase RutF
MAECDPQQDISKALAQVPSGLFILTARSEDKSSGILVSWVQQTCFEPPMVSVAIAKGRPIMPLISQTRQFGLCQLAESDKLIVRRFSSDLDPSEDPFLSFDMLRDTASTVPILAQSMSYLECQVACHIDVEGDHDLFVGRVVAGKHQKGKPWIHVRKNGFAY